MTASCDQELLGLSVPSSDVGVELKYSYFHSITYMYEYILQEKTLLD